MLIENGAGIGLLLDGGPHFVKNVCVKGLYNDREDPPIEGNNGVVVGLTGLNNLLDGVVVKQYGGHAFVVDGTGTTITNSNVDLVGLDGFVVTGAGSTLSGNGVQNARHGFIVTATALDTDLETNETEDLDGDGFVVDGDTAVLTEQQCPGQSGRGFVIGGDSGLLDTNTAEDNVADGFIVTGSSHTLKINIAQGNGGRGFVIGGDSGLLDNNTAETTTRTDSSSRAATTPSRTTRPRAMAASGSMCPEAATISTPTAPAAMTAMGMDDRTRTDPGRRQDQQGKR